ncbi:MAG: outer membrane protein assembly factor BamD [Bdellovibrionales bacterium]|nr:outer membrane protein assembly factor BamD [Bdellovibrionales bacterium]
MIRISGTLKRLAFVAASIAFVSCSGAPIDENDPAQLYADAESDVQAEHYLVALEKMRSLKNRFPYSKHAVEASLRIADIYFLQESFNEAAISYESFKDLHPKHEKVAYAMFRQGVSYYKDLPSTVARDMVSGHRSIEAFEAFLARFPKNAEAADAKKYVLEIRNLLAQKEMYVAYFYFRREYYSSAKTRYEKIVNQFPDTTSFEEAKKKLSEVTQLIAQGKGFRPEDSERIKNLKGGSNAPGRPPGIMGPGQ